MRNSYIHDLTLVIVAFHLTTSILFCTALAGNPSADIFRTKSGRNINMYFIRRYIQLDNESNLEHMIFEYNPTSNYLFSYKRIINLPDPSSRNRITLSPNVTRHDKQYIYSGNTNQFTMTYNSSLFMSILDNGDTFLFDADKNYSLAGAFGDAMDLHSINHPRHDIFINHYKAIKKSNADSSIEPSPEPKACKRMFEFSVHVISDHYMCARLGNNNTLAFYMIEQFIVQSIKIFMDLACVDIRLIGITSYCAWNRRLNFKKQCRDSKRNHPKCQTPLSKHIIQEMINYPSPYEGQREFELFISGLDYAGNMAGLTYKSRACERRLSKIWIKGFSRIALYHEIGHLLGANHASDGIMQRNVPIIEGNSLRFSSKSSYEINHFINEDPRSWCLRRIYGTTFANLLADGWRTKKFSLPDSAQCPNLRFESISIASLSSHKKLDLVFLISSSKYMETDRILRLFYGSVKNIWRVLRSPGLGQVKYRSLELKFSEDYSHFNLRVFTSRNSKSKSVILSYVYFNYSGGNLPIPYYIIGSVKSNGDIDVHSWSTEKVIGNVDLLSPFLQEVDIDVNIGNIRSQGENDLLYMQMNYETDRQTLGTSLYNGRRILKYKIGFNLSIAGVAQNGWSEYFTIPGEFKLAVSISGSIMDVDDDGNPDLVIYVVERGSPARPSGYSYFRVGKYLSSNGIVEGGWTDHKMTPSVENRYTSCNEQSMDVWKDFKTSNTALISAQRLVTYNSKIYITKKYREVELSFSHNNLFKKVMETVTKYSAIETVAGNCEICYGGSLKQIKKCQDDLKVCKSQIEKLRIFENASMESISSNSRMKINHKQFGDVDTFSQRLANRSIGFLHSTVNRNLMNISNSIYCTGFQYFLSSKNVCDTIDSKSVYSKGLQITFSDYFEGINSTSLFEDTLGSNGNGLLILVQADISGRKWPTKTKIKNGLRQLRAKLQFPSFKVTSKKKMFKTTKSWSKSRKVWIITFYFTSNIGEFV